MSSIATKHALSEPDRRFARHLVDRSKASTLATLSFQDGRGERTSVDLPGDVLRAFTDVLSKLADSGEVVIVNQEAELSPEDAAKILRISRPLVYKRMDDGTLKYRALNSHRKVLLKDVLALKADEDRRNAAARELADDAIDLELNYAEPKSAPRR